MATASIADPLEKGLLALEHGHTYLAMTCLEQALASGKTPKICSYLAYCLALNKRGDENAVRLAREALDAEPGNVTFRLNLARTLIMSGDKSGAILVLREGLQSGADTRLAAELELLGTRKKPTFPALSRGHFLNKYSGLIFSRLGLR